MQYQKCSLDLYLNFLIASQKQYTGSELSRVSPESMAHDSVSRWLSSVTLNPKLLWTDAGTDPRLIPVDYRIYDDTRDGKSKNDHGREMLKASKIRGFQPQYVLMDCWYTAVPNLKAIDLLDWNWIGELQTNRLVSLPNQKGIYGAVSDLDWTTTLVHKVWLKAYGWVVWSARLSPHTATLPTSPPTICLWTTQRHLLAITPTAGRLKPFTGD